MGDVIMLVGRPLKVKLFVLFDSGSAGAKGHAFVGRLVKDCVGVGDSRVESVGVEVDVAAGVGQVEPEVHVGVYE